MGVVAMCQICNTYTSVKDLVGHIPNQTIIKGAVGDILGHLRAAAKIVVTTKFNCGEVAMNSEAGVQPDINISEKVVTCKRKNTDQAASTSSRKQTECTYKNNTNINVEVSTTHESTNHAVDTNPEETTSNSAPCKEIPRRVNCDHNDNQCHCGLLKSMASIWTRHTKIIYGCAVGRIILTMELSKSARKFALKHSSLWSHFRHQHESRYHNYCDIKGCYYGSDEKWTVVKHKFNIHNIPMPEENKCPCCAKAFGQMSKLGKHLVTCQTMHIPLHAVSVVKIFTKKNRLPSIWSRSIQRMVKITGNIIAYAKYVAQGIKHAMALPRKKLIENWQF